jgi:hypothetical protein
MLNILGATVQNLVIRETRDFCTPGSEVSMIMLGNSL